MSRDVEGVVGILPASGWGSRLTATPISKELLPAWHSGNGPGDGMPLPAMRCSLEALRRAGVRSALVPIRSEKWDLARYLEKHEEIGLRIALVLTGATRGPVESVSHALSFAGRSVVAFGFPDIIFQASNPFGLLLEHLREGGADGVLGLFPHPSGRRADSVSVSSERRVTGIAGGARPSQGGWSWAVAVWNAEVSAHLQRYVAGSSPIPETDGPVDDPGLTLGEAFRAGLEEGLRFDGIPVSDRAFLDIGEPRGWAAAVRAAFGDRDGA